MEFEGIESSFNLSITGLDGIKKAIDDAAAIIERIPDATFDVRPNVVPIDPAKVFDVNAFKERLRGIAFDMQKEWARLRAFEFKPTMKSKEFEGNVTALFDRVKGVMETAFNKSRDIGGVVYEDGQFSKLGTVVQLMDRYAEAVASGRMSAEDQAKATKALEQMSAQLLTVFSAMPNTFTAATASLTEFGKKVNSLARTNKSAARELQAGLAAVVTSYGTEISETLTTLEQNVKMFESSMGGLEQPLIPLGMAARALSGDLTKVMTVDPTNLKQSLQDMQRLLGDLSVSTGSFEQLFGPKALQAAQEYASIQQRILELQEQVTGEGASFDSKAAAALELSRLSTEKALQDQKVAGSMLASRREAETGLLGLEGFDRLTPYIEATAAKTAQLKDSYGNYLGLLGVGTDVLRNQSSLYATILNLAKTTGDVEGGVISQDLERLNVLERLRDYGARMEATAKTIQDIEGQTNSTMKLRAALLQEAANAYGAQAKLATGPAADQAFTNMIRVEGQLREQLAGVNFQSAMTDFGASIVRGSLPAMSQLVNAVTAYQANSTSAFATGADDVRMLDRVLVLLRARYDELTSSGSKLFTAQRLKTAEAMRYLAGAREQATGSSGPVSAADATNIAHLASVEQTRERAAQRIYEEYNKIYALQVAGERVASNQLKLEELFAQAIAKGVPVEQELAKHVRNRGTALASMLNEYNGLLSAAKNEETSAQTKLAYYQAAVDVLKVMQALVTDMGGKTRVSNQTLTTENLGKNIASLQEQARLVEEGPRQTERLNRELRAGLEISRARQQLEEKIVDSIRRAEMEAQGLGKVWEAQNKILQLVMQASKEGVAIPAGMEQLLGQQREAAQEIADIYTRLSDVSAAGMAPTHQLTLVEERLKTIQRLKEIVGSTPINLTVNGAQVQHTAETLTQIEEKLKTEIEGLNIAMGKIKPQPQPQLVDIAAVGVDQAKVDNTRAEASSRLLGTMKQQKEELLSGVNVLGNWRGLLDNISTALSKNLDIEASQVNTLLGQEQVFEAIARTAGTIMSKLEAIPDQSVRVAPLAEVAKLLEVLSAAPGPVKAKLGFDALAESVTRMQAELANVGSPKIADLESRIKALGVALKYAVDDTAARSGPSPAAFDNVRQGIDRTLGTLKDYRGAIDSLYRTKLFSGQASTQELTGLTTTSAEVKRVIDLMGKLDGLTTKVSTDLSRFGLTFADITTKSGRNTLYNATKDDQSKVYVRIADNIREINTLAGVLPRMINQSQTLSSVFSGWSKPLADMRDQATKADQQLTQMYAKQQHRATAAAGSNIFDVFRMSWFIQLRAFWSMYLGITQTIQEVMNYTHTMNVLRAVTQSTKEDIASLEHTFDSLAKSVPVSITKLAEGSLLVAKAGFNAEETIKVVESAAKLSYATHADLAQTADLQTVILRSWNMNADQAAKVGDQLFNAVNQSRSDIEGLQAAFGYVSGIAPQANVTLTEMLSVFSVLSNAGLSMDQAGTYTRQFLNDLLNPTDKLVKILTSLGVSLDQVDPRLHSLGDILKLLNSRGMSSAQAFEGMSIRAASAFGVLLSNSDMLEQYSTQIARTGQVNEAFKHSTKDLSSELILLQNAFVSGGNSIKNMFGPALIEASRSIRDMIGLFQFASDAAQGSALGSIATSFSNGVVKAAILAGALSGIIRLVQFLNGAFLALGVSVGVLTKAHVVVAVATLASSVAAYAFGKSARDAESYVNDLRESVENLQKTGKEGFELKIKIETDKNIANSVQAAVEQIKDIDVNAPGGGNAVRILSARVSSQLITSPDEELKGLGEQIKKAMSTVTDNGELARRVESIVNSAREAFNKNIKKFSDDAEAARDVVNKAMRALAVMPNKIDDTMDAYKRHHIAPGKGDLFNPTAAHLGPDVYNRNAGLLTRASAGISNFSQFLVGRQSDADELNALISMLKSVKATIDEAASNVENFNYDGSTDDLANLQAYTEQLNVRIKAMRSMLAKLVAEAPAGIDIGNDETFKKAVTDIDELDKSVSQSIAKLTSIKNKLVTEKLKSDQTLGADAGDALKTAKEQNIADLVEKTKQQIRSVTERVASAKAGADIAKLTPDPSDNLQVGTEIKEAIEEYKTVFGQLNAVNIPVTKLPADVQKQLSDFVKTLYELNVEFDNLSEKRGLDALNSYEAVIKRITQATAGPGGKPLFDEAAVAKLVGLPDAYLKTFRDMTRLDALRSVDRLPQDFADAVYTAKTIYTDKRFAPIQSEGSSELAKFIKHINEFRKASTDLQNKMRETNVAGEHFRLTLGAINDVLAGGDLRKLDVYFGDAFESANAVAPQLKTNLKELRDALLKTSEIGGAMGGNVESALADYKNAGDAATTAWSGVKDSLVATTKALNDLGDKSRQIGLEMKRSDYEYAKTRRALSTERQSPENDFYNQQENIRLQGEFIRENAPLMSTEDLIGGMKEYQTALIEFARQYPDQPRGRAAVDTADQVQETIRALYNQQREQVELEKQAQLAIFTNLTAVLAALEPTMHTLASAIDRFTAKLDAVPSAQLSRGPAGKLEPYKARVGSKETPGFTPEVEAAIANSATKHGWDPEFMRRVAYLESGGRPGIANGTSSAKGLFQFTKSTGAKYGMTRESDFFDPNMNADAAGQELLHIQQVLSQAGVPVNSTSLYLGLQLGPQGAVDLMKAAEGKSGWTPALMTGMNANYRKDNPVTARDNPMEAAKAYFQQTADQLGALDSLDVRATTVVVNGAVPGDNQERQGTGPRSHGDDTAAGLYDNPEGITRSDISDMTSSLNIEARVQELTALTEKLRATSAARQELNDKMAAQLPSMGASVPTEELGTAGRAMEDFSRSIGSINQQVNSSLVSMFDAMVSGSAAAATQMVRNFIDGSADIEQTMYNLEMTIIQIYVEMMIRIMMMKLMASIGGSGMDAGSLASAGPAPSTASGNVGPAMAYTRAHTGGLIGYAAGGLVTDGVRHKDSMLAALTKGEMVIQEPVVRALGVDFFQDLNSGRTGQAVARLAGAASVGSSVTAPDGVVSSGQSQYPSGGQSDGRGVTKVNVTNIVDPAALSRFLSTDRGRRTILNIVSEHPYMKREG